MMATTQTEQVLSDIHVSTHYEVIEENTDELKAVSRFEFELPDELKADNKDDNSEKKIDELLDEDDDLVVERQPNKATQKSTEVITLCHRLQTELADVGLQVWNGCLLLCDYILYNYKDFTKKIVLDLGAGVGLTSIVTAMFASQTYCTDYNDDIVQNAQMNVDLNSHLLSNGVESVIMKELDWLKCAKEESIYSLTKEELRNIDFILAAEVVYDIDITIAFFSTVQMILTTPKTLYISLEKREVFSKYNLEVVSPAYSHFMECLDILVCNLSDDINIEYQKIPTDFKQYFQYNRVKQLELWRICSKYPSR